GAWASERLDVPDQPPSPLGVLGSRIDHATRVAVVVGVVVALVGLVIGIALDDPHGTASVGTRTDPIATTLPRFTTPTTFYTTPTTSGPINTPATPLGGGSAGGWVITARDDRGYTSRVTLSVDAPVKIDQAPASRVGRSVKACAVNSSTDAVVPVR